MNAEETYMTAQRIADSLPYDDGISANVTVQRRDYNDAIIEIFVQFARYDGECCGGQSSSGVPWTSYLNEYRTGTSPSECGRCGRWGMSYTMSPMLAIPDHITATELKDWLSAELTKFQNQA